MFRLSKDDFDDLEDWLNDDDDPAVDRKRLSNLVSRSKVYGEFDCD